jgi:acyl carrier protein
MALIAATGKPLPKFIPSFAWFLEGVVTKGFGKRKLYETAAVRWPLNAHSPQEMLSMATVEERVKAITARVLQIDPGEIKLEHAFTVDLGAESVQSIELVAMFEEEFGIEMDEDAALAVDNVGDAIEFITKTCEEQGVEV